MTTTQRRPGLAASQSAKPIPAAAPVTDLPKWWQGNVGVFDCETTGTDPLTARMVSYASLYVDAKGETVSSKHGLVDSGVPIPEGAREVHGISDELAKTGVPHDQALRILIGDLSYLKAAKEPLVIFNASYDLTILHVQAKAIGLHVPEVYVLDPLVLDRSLDRYRKGSRKLADVCAHYNVHFVGDAHDAKADAVATALLIFAMARRWPQLSSTLEILHKTQAVRREEWAEKFEQHLRKTDPEAVVERGWPVRNEALGIERTEQPAVFDLPEKPKREAKRYEIPRGAPSFTCREASCAATVWLVPTGNGDKKVVVDASGFSHFLSCTKPDQFSKGSRA